MSSVGVELDRAEDLAEGPNDEFILGTALLSMTSRHLIPDLLKAVPAQDFIDTHLGEMWGAAQTIINRGDAISRRALLAERDTPAIRARLQQMSGEPVEVNKLRHAATTVVDLAKTRRLIQALKRIAEHTPHAETYSEALQFASERLNELAEAKPSKDAHAFADVLANWWEWLSAPQDQIRTIATPWTELDDMLAGGLHPGRSYVIGGRPGEGKSIALLNLAVNAAEHGHPGVIFSVEMGEVEVVSRIMAAGSHAEYRQITKRQLDDHNHMKIAEYADTYGAMPLTLVDRSDITVDYIAAQCRTLKRRPEGLDVIVVDYLQLLRESDSRQSRERQVANISRALKILARELDCAVIIACQLNRNSAAADRKPLLSDLRESGAIEQDCDVAILLHHELANGQPSGEVTLCIAKNRTGKIGSVTLPWRAYQARIG
jgi:replicative DNA helicase